MLVNGEAIDSITAFDRGLQYGDGLFETIAVVNSRPCQWRRHLQRLQSGCERLGMRAPDVDTLLQEVHSLTGLLDRAVVKLIITRGNSQRGYAPPDTGQPNRILYLSDWPEDLQMRADAGVRLRFCATRLGINPSIAGIKHLNRLEQVLARNEWRDGSILEGIMLDVQGRVVEGTMSNLFVEKNGRLRTPELSQSGVKGVVRELVLDVAMEMGLPVSETTINPDDLIQADACYITNSILGVRRVAGLEQRNFNEAMIIHPVMKEAATRVFDS